MSSRADAGRTVWIKICGLTTPDAVEAAVQSGADAIGFVFAPSVRRVEPERAARLSAGVGVPRIAVMQHPTQQQLDEVCAGFAPDVLQTDIDDIERLNIPAAIEVLPVIRARAERPQRLPERFLFEGPVSGSGQVADWAAAAELAASARLVLAGGLSPANIATAIRSVQPYGVDVSSGVEASPGIKDVDKIEQFVRNARAALNGAT